VPTVVAAPSRGRCIQGGRSIGSRRRQIMCARCIRIDATPGTGRVSNPLKQERPTNRSTRVDFSFETREQRGKILQSFTSDGLDTRWVSGRRVYSNAVA
jgi:hypothetical protein